MKKFSKLYIYLLVAFLLAVIGLILYNYIRPKTPELPSPPLKDLASQNDILVGNHAILNRLNEKPYADILKSEFNYVLADNTPNWFFTDGGLRPGPNEYNYKQMDEVMAFAESNNMPVEAHHYLWGEEKWLPDWLKNGGYNREQVLEFAKDHINTVGKKYSGRIAMWTVVNEPFTRGRHIYGLRDWWADNTGGNFDYIDDAFRWAKEADPNSKLILNDFDNESINETSNLQYEYMKGALERKVPIDAIGMQMHLDGTHPPVKDEVKANMQRFADLGLDIYITEFDINMNDVKADSSDKNKIQGDIYYDMMRACLETKACKQFAFLGITDKETWYNHMGLKDARPLMFDSSYKPKPAYFRTRDALIESAGQ